MADDNKLWFEMGVRDKVTEHITDILTNASLVQKEMDKITASESAVYQNAAKLEEVYDKIALAMQRITDARSKTTDPAKLMKLDEMEKALNSMKAAFKEIENNETKLGIRGSVALEQLKQGFQLMCTQVSRYANEIENTSKKEAKAHDDEIRRQDKLKSKLYELQNLRKKLSDMVLQAPSGFDTSAATKIAGQLWSKEMQVKQYMKNGRDLPLDFFGADYNELKRQANEMYKTINGKVVEAQRNAKNEARLLAQANRDLASTYARVEQESSKSSRVLEQMKNQWGSIVSLYGAEKLLKNVIQIGGEFEVQHIALQSILGDIQQANSMFEQVKELAVVSPFNFRELATYAKQIAAFGIPYEEMYDTTKRLADMSAGLGVDMQRLILAYGQVRSAAVLRGQELRQFTEAGIPMVRALAQEFTRLNGRVVSTAEVFDLISKRAVPFEMVKKVLWDMTNEGGRFYDMQFTLADTLAGKWSNLQDAWEIMLSDFAKGESISGRMLKGMVTTITWLIENINTLSPLIAGLVTSYATIKTLNFAKGFGNLGFNAIDKNVEKAQRLRAIELARLKINGDISRAQYTQLMNQNLNKGNYYKVLAMEGKLNALQIQRAYTQGHINKQELAYLVQLKAITNEQRKQILLNNLNVGALGRVGFAAKGLFRSLNAAMGPIGWIMLAVDVVATGLLTWKGRVDEINEKNNQLVDGFSKKGAELKESLESMTKVPTNDDEYKSSIEGMKEILKQHSANYNAIILEAEGIKTLAEKYEYLKKAVQDAKDIYDKAEALAPDFADATRSAFDDVKEWARELSKQKGAGRFSFSFDWDEMQFRKNEDIFISRVKDLAEKIKAEIPNIGKDSTANSLFRQLRNNLEEELGVGAREKMFINIKLNELLHIEDDDALADIVTDKFSTAIGSAEPRIANKIRNGKELNQAEQDKVQELINAAISDTEKQYPLFANRLQQLLNSSRFTALITLNFAKTGNANDLQKFIYGNFPSYSNERIKTIATSWATSGSMFAAQNSAKSDIDKAYNEKLSRQKALDKLKKDKNAEKAQIDQAQKLVDESNIAYKDLLEAASVGLGYDYEGEKKRSNKGGASTSKKDTELESIKNRVELYKKFFSELENAKKLYGEKGGLDFLDQNGFKSVFGWGLKDVTNYRQSLTELTSTLSLTTEERKKFFYSVDADKVIQKRKEETEAMRIYISELKNMMSVMSENYQTYKKWVDLTGDEALAARVAGVAQNSSYADYLRDLMQKELAKSNINMTPDDVFGLDKAGISKYGENIETLWEAWRKNQQNLKKEQLDLYEDAIKNSKDYADKLADVNRELEKQIAAIEALGGDDKLIENARKNAAKKISSIKWDQFKDENDWGRVFGNLDNMPLESIKKMITAMKEYAKTTKMDVTETKAWYEALEKLTDRKAILDPLGSLADAVKDYQTAHEKRKIVDQQIERTKNNPELSEDKKRKLLNKLQETRNDLLDEETDALSRANKSMKSFANGISKLGSSLSQLGDSIGGNFGDFMGGIGGMLGDIGNGMSSVGDLAQSMSQGGFAGAIGKVSAAVSIISSTISMVQKLDSILGSTESIYEKYAERQRKINKAREAIEDYEVAAMRTAQKNSNWLYSNGLSEMRNNGYIRQNLLKNYANTQLAAQEIYQDKRSGLSKWGPAIVGAIVAIVITAVTWGLGSVGGAAVGSGIAAALGGAGTAAVGAAVAAGAGAAIGTALRSAGDAIFYKEGQTAARNNLRVQTQHSSFWRGEKTQNLEEWVRENYGKELFDKDNYDLIDVDLAKKLLENGPTLVGETRETLERLVEIAEQINEIQDQIHDYVGQRFSPLIDNMTDSLWEWLKSGKNMMDSFYDYASDTFAEIAKDAVKSFLKINLLDNYQKTLEDMFNAYSFGLFGETELMLGVAHVAGEIADSFEALAPTLENLGKILVEAFDVKGYDIVNGSGSNSSSATIKNVTESTADLIASYVNAIRADTGANRLTLTQILIGVQQQAEMPALARQQLEQLRMIVTYTKATSERLVMIYDILHANVTGANKFTI